MSKHYLRLLLIGLTAVVASASHAEQTLTAVAERTWGLLLGDVFTVRLDLSAITEQLDMNSLPATGKRYGNWLYLKEIAIEQQQALLHYQVINVPLTNTIISTPSLQLQQTNQQWLAVSSIPITIGPLLAADNGIEAIEAQADRAPLLIPTIQLAQQLRLSLAIALITAIILGLAHVNWRLRNRAPFAQAVQQLSVWRWSTVTADQAARILHAAFNGTADTTVVYGEIDQLLADHPWLLPLAEDIKRFYQQSEQHFFASKQQAGSDLATIRKLAKACRAQERCRS